MKKELTAEQIYKRNQRRSKRLRALAPVTYWTCLALAVVCFIFAVKNSFGNVGEIISMLDSKKYSGDELEANYNYLISKYGEWVVGSGGSGFMITFINIGNALFSGLMITNCVMCVIFWMSAYILGKWLLPKFAADAQLQNQDMVNLTVLRDHEEAKKAKEAQKTAKKQE